MKLSYVPASLIFCCILLFGISSASLADGFDNRYEVRYGDFNGDGQMDDLFVRQQPRIILIHGDVSTPILIRGDVEAFVLRHNGNGTFTLVTGLSSSQRTTFSGWPQADVVHTLGDLNADGVTDLVIKGISELPGLVGAADQIVFADPDNRKAPPVHLRAIDADFRQFFEDVYGNLRNRDYYFQTAVENGWYNIEEGPTYTAFWAIDYLIFYGFCWSNCTILASDTTYDDVYDPNATPDLCSQFDCQWNPIAGRWHAYVTAQELELVIEYGNFNQSALGLTDTFDNVIQNGSIECGSADAIQIGAVLEAVLGTDFMGGVLAGCDVLESEADYDPLALGRIRLGALYAFFQSTISKVAPKSDPGNAAQNAADLQEALDYLNDSPTFRDLWAKVQAAGVEVIVDRDPEIGSEFDYENNTIIWDPDTALIIEEGVSSPATSLAHEAAHAERYNRDKEGFLKDNVWEGEIVPGGPPNEMTVIYTPSAEEERAADVEAEIQQELGEPVRQRYGDDSGTVTVDSPVFSCRRGNQSCDDLIEMGSN